jgi:hypothetical protein
LSGARQDKSFLFTGAQSMIPAALSPACPVAGELYDLAVYLNDAGHLQALRFESTC